MKERELKKRLGKTKGTYKLTRINIKKKLSDLKRGKLNLRKAINRMRDKRK